MPGLPGLKNKVTEMMKAAMKAQNKDEVTYTRSLLAAIRKREIDERKDLPDAEIQKVCASAIKQRKESIEAFQKGGRPDLVANEEAELKFLEQFLPAQMSDAELVKLVDAAISESGAKGPQDLGKVMKSVLPKVQGRADGKRVSELVKSKLPG